MLLSQFEICILSEKIVSKVWKFIHFSDHSLAFQSICWKVWKKLNSKFALKGEIRMRNSGQSFCKEKNFPRRLPIHHYVEFSQNDYFTQTRNPGSGADPDRCNRCNRCKCIGQSHMIDNLEVCGQDFLSDANHFNFPNAPLSL